MSKCKCDRKGQENALLCRNASKRLSVTSGVAKIVLKPCDCHCHWAPHRDDCEGGEDCICQRSPRITTLPALDSRLDSLLSDPDWDDCDKGEAYEVLSELRKEIGSVLELLRIRAENFGEARMAFDYARSFPLLAAVAAGLVKKAKP